MGGGSRVLGGLATIGGQRRVAERAASRHERASLRFGGRMVFFKDGRIREDEPAAYPPRAAQVL